MKQDTCLILFNLWLAVFVLSLSEFRVSGMVTSGILMMVSFYYLINAVEESPNPPVKPEGDK